MHMVPPRKPSKLESPPTAPKQNTTSWGNVSEWYDAYLENTPDSYQEMVVAPNLLRIVNLKKGIRVLDIGCGQGYFTRKFAEAGAEVIGADISKQLIELAQKRAPSFSTCAAVWRSRS